MSLLYHTNIPVYSRIEDLPVDGSVLFAIVRPQRGFATGGGDFDRAWVFFRYTGNIGDDGEFFYLETGASAGVPTTFPLGWKEVF